MKRTSIIMAGGAALAIGAVLAGASLARGQGSRPAPTAPAAAAADSNPPLPWTFPLPPVSGRGYADISKVLPNGPWPDSTSVMGPVQPIFYRHDIHAGQYRIPCFYCHNNAANSWTANIPTVSTCMGCHLVISAADTAGNPNAWISMLRSKAAADSTIPWVRVYKISEHAHFPHMRHVNAGLACQTCHGNVQQQTRVFAVQDVNNMGWCTDCHMRRGITRDCTACHF
jgi:hypothetical protein